MRSVWASLPDQFSQYGSKELIIMAVLFRVAGMDFIHHFSSERLRGG
jgi:hypothetical protein